jgi:DNA-binding transcriptional MerR regulator
MDDDGRALLTIGRLARRTGLPVRTIRYWSDIGAVPPARRTASGYRLYDATSVARLELVRTLRELGLGLEEVRRVLAKETTVAQVAATHVEALDAQIRTLRLRRAVLATVAKRRSSTEEMALMNNLARLSAQQRKQIIDDFVDEVFRGLDPDPGLQAHLRQATPELPEDPIPEQVDAWVELAELVQDPPSAGAFARWPSTARRHGRRAGCFSTAPRQPRPWTSYAASSSTRVWRANAGWPRSPRKALRCWTASRRAPPTTSAARSC